MGEQIKEADRLGPKTVLGLERRADAAAVGAPCGEIYRKRSGKFSVRAVKRQPCDEGAVREGSGNRLRSAKLLVAHLERVRKLRKGVERGVFTLKYRENVGPTCKIAVTGE